MFKHLFINKLKIILKNKSMLFWTLIFPFILGTFFQLALGNVDEAFELNIIPIAVVENEYYQGSTVFKEVITGLSEEGENQLFTTEYVDEEKAKELLNNEEIEGYIIITEENIPKMVVKQDGINQTIIKSVLDEYYQLSSAATQAIQYNYKVVYNGVLNSLYKNHDYIVDD